MTNPVLVAGTKNNGTISSGVTSQTVTSTGSVTTGNLQIVTIAVAGATAPTGITPPGGWSTVLATTTTASGGVVSAAIFSKLATATGSFSGAFTWTTTSTGGEWSFSEWSGVGPALIDGTSTTSLNATSTSPTSPTKTPTAGQPLDTLVCCIFGGALSATTVAVPGGMSSVFAVSGSASIPALGFASLALTGTGATGTKTWTFGTTQTSLGVSFLLPASQVWNQNFWPDLVLPHPGQVMRSRRGRLTVPFFQVWTPPFRWDDFAKRSAPRPTEFPPPVLGFPPQQVWFPPNYWDDFTSRAKPAAEFPVFTLGLPPIQVWYPHAPWDDFAKRAAPKSADFPAWTFGSPPPQLYPPDRWPDFASKNKPSPQLDRPWGFIPTPKQVWFPPDPWPDLISRKQPPAYYNLAAQRLPSQPPFAPWVNRNWPDFLPQRISIVGQAPYLAFVPVIASAAQVWFPPNNWPDIIPPIPGQGMKAMRGRMAVGFSQVWYPPGQWPDSAPALRRPIEFPQPAFVPVVVTTPAPTVAWWANWPDLISRKSGLGGEQDFEAFFGVPLPVLYPSALWPDYLYAKPRPVEFPQPAFIPLVPAAAAPNMGWVQWPDFASGKKMAADLTRPWAFIPPPKQVWFPPNYWGDFATKKPSPLNYDPLALVQVVVAPPITWNAWTQWPDFAIKAKPAAQLNPWIFLEPPPQVWYPPFRWDDFTRRKAAPLNYPPTTLVQTVITPWNDWTQWPDWVPKKDRPGFLAALQQYTSRFPGVITLATVTGVMQAFEFNSDSAIFAINAIPFGNPTNIVPVSKLPAATAVVSLEETGILLQGGPP